MLLSMQADALIRHPKFDLGSMQDAEQTGPW